MKLIQAGLKIAAAVCGLLAFAAQQVYAGAVTKAGTGTDLNAGASWSGSVGPTPSDIATWASSSLGAGLTLASSTNWQGISVSGALTDISVTGAGVLTLGASGFDMSASAVNMTLANTVTLGASQTWTVNSGKTNIVGKVQSTAASLIKEGAGVLKVNTAALSVISGDLTVNAGTVQIANDLYVSGLYGSGTIETPRGVNKWFFVTNAVDETFSGVLQTRTGATSRELGFSKGGAGTLTLSNVNTFNDQLAVKQGVLKITGSVSPGYGNSGVILVGDTASQKAILNIAGGTVNANKTGSPSVSIANLNNGIGAVYMSSGTLTTVSEIHVGEGKTSNYAAFSMDDGTVTCGSYFVVGFNNDRSVFNQRGGAVTLGTANLLTIGAGGSGSIGVANLSGGTFTATSGANAGVRVGEQGVGILNVSGTAALTFGGVGLSLGNNAGSKATANLLGGTVSANSVSHTSSGTGTLNFNGGKLKATGPNATFMTGLTSARVFDGGAVIDDGGYAVTIAQPLLAPTGSGVSGISSFTAGTGYIDQPVVTVVNGSGDTTGGGATAIAQIDYAAGTVTNIVITCPGTNYTATPTFTLAGGGYTTLATITGAAPTANTSGGLTKTGSGTLKLSGASTYTGSTAVNQGTLEVAGSLAAESAVSVASGARLVASGTVRGSVSVAAGAALAGSGTLSNWVTLSSGNAAISLTNGAASTLTLAGGLTLDDGNVLAFDVGATADKIAVTGGSYTKNAGTVTITIARIAGFTAGTYDLLTGASISSTDGFVLGNTVEGFGLALTTSGGNLQLVVTADWVTAWWTGDQDGSWRTLNAGNGNWATSQSGTTDVGATPVATFNLHFSADSAANFATTLGADTSVNTLTFDTGDAVTIGGANTLTVSAGITNGAAAGANTISVGSLVLGGAQAWVNDSANALTVSAPVSGPCALTKSGNGTVTLTAANTYSGPTTISAGTLQVGDGITDGSLASAITNNASLVYNVASAQAAAGMIGGSGVVSKSGAGTLTLSGVNTFSGATVINSGTLTVGGAGQLGGGAYAGTVTNNGALKYNSSAAQTLSGLIQGSGALIQAGSGTLTLGLSTNVYAGGTTITNGTLVNDAGGAGGKTGTVTPFGSGTLVVNGGVARLGYNAQYPNNNATFAITNALAVNGGTLFADDGKQHLTGNLSIGGSGGTLGATYNGGSADGDKGLYLDGVVSGNGALTIRHSGYSLNHTYNASIVHFANPGNTYSGTVSVIPMSGTAGGSYLGVNAGTALSGATVSLSGNNTCSAQQFGTSPLVFKTGLGSVALGALAGSGDVVLNGYNESTHAYGADAIALATGNNGTTTAYSGAMSGAGGLTKTGSGTFTLSGSNTYSGATVIQGGTLLLPEPPSAPLAPLAYTFNTGTATNSGSLSVTTTVGGTGSAPTFSATGGPRPGLGVATFASGATGYVDIVAASLPNLSGSANYTIGMWIKTTQAGSAYLYKGDLVWNNYTETFYLNAGNGTAGTKVGGVQWAGGWVTGATAVNDGTWKFISIVRTNNSSTVYVNGVADGTDTDMNLGENGIQRIRLGWSPSNDGSVPFVGDISGSYVYNSALSATQIYALMNVGPGKSVTLTVLPTNTAVTITEAGAKLDINGQVQTVGSLAGVSGSAVALGNGTLTINPQAGSTEFAGTISGVGGSVVKTGAGTQVLSGTSTHTGVTRVDAGTLAGTCWATNSSAAVSAGGTLAPGNGGAGTMAFGSLTIAAGGKLAFDLAATNASDKIVTTGALALNGLSLSDCSFTALAGLSGGTYVLVDAASVSGSLGSEVEGFSAALHKQVRLFVDEANGDLLLNVSSRGTLITIQ